MRGVEGSLQGASTKSTINRNSTPNTGFGPSAYIARHPGEFEAEQVARFWDVGNLGKRLAKKFYPTPEQSRADAKIYAQGMRARLGAALRSELLDCGCLDPFTTYHREVCMRWHK